MDNAKVESEIVLNQDAPLPVDEDYAIKTISCKTLDSIFEDVLLWEKQIIEADQEVHKLKSQIKALEWKLQLMETSVKESKKQKVDNVAMIQNLQESIEQHLSNKDELKCLKQQLDDVRKSSEMKEHNLKLEIDELKKSVSSLKDKHKKETRDLTDRNTDKVQQLEKQHVNELKNLNNKLFESQEKCHDLEELHESTMIKVQMEYENKISILQVQVNKAQTNSNNHKGNVSNEIFRRKLQHVQEASSKEVSRLNEEVKHLQKVLQDRNKQVSFQNSNLGSNHMKRKRP